jgi:hypothetical protein
MTTKGKRRKRRRRAAAGEGRSAGSARPIASATGAGRPGLNRAARPGSEPLSARRGPTDRPPALWGSFPLSELVVFIALILLVVGFITGAAVTLGVGLGLGALAGVELAAREHFAGYRSHTLLLAGSVALVVLAALFFLGPSGLPPLARIAIPAAAFGIAAWWLTTMFRRRSGGLPFRLSGLRRR